MLDKSILEDLSNGFYGKQDSPNEKAGRKRPEIAAKNLNAKVFSRRSGIDNHYRAFSF